MNQSTHSHRIPPGLNVPTGVANTYATVPISKDAGSQSQANPDLIKRSMESTRHGIPGLGMGFNHSPMSSAQTAPDPSSTLASARHVLPQMHSPRPIAQATDVISLEKEVTEEGEVSEAEMEDLYEPEASDVDKRIPAHSRAQHNTRSAATALNSNAWTGNMAASGDPLVQGMRPEYSSRHTGFDSLDRDESYSPCLSPAELERSSMVDDRGAQITNGDDRTTTAAATPASESRKLAREAILRAWPLNVRFQDFIARGVDHQILKDIFQELGLEIGVDEAGEALSNSMDIDTASRKASPPQGHKPDNKVVENGSAATNSKASESRKDRIARLLAAKGNTSSPKMSQTTSDSNTHPTESQETTPHLPKKMSEKSKLLQEKMAALKATRSEQARKELQAGLPAVVVANTPFKHLPPQSQDDPIKSMTIGDESRNKSVPESIPGLSSGPESIPQVNHKRPLASDFADFPATTSVVPAKRSFGQTRETKPFLINISEDEDDEESVEERPHSHDPSNQATTPAHQPLLPAELIASTEADPSSQGPNQNPGQGPTVARAAPNRANLASVTKKIEEMRRKIAEAEAKKKAIQSRSGSTTPQQAADQASSENPAKLGSSKPPGQHDIKVQQNTVTPSVELQTPAPGHEMGQKLAKNLDIESSPSIDPTRSRSRAASERVPVLEAHRHQQTLKLQLLQSQVAAIEREIERSRQEEEQLKKEMVLEDDEVSDPTDAGHAAEESTILSSAKTPPVSHAKVDTELGEVTRVGIDPAPSRKSPPTLDESAGTAKESTTNVADPFTSQTTDNTVERSSEQDLSTGSTGPGLSGTEETDDSTDDIIMVDADDSASESGEASEDSDMSTESLAANDEESLGSHDETGPHSADQSSTGNDDDSVLAGKKQVPDAQTSKALPALSESSREVHASLLNEHVVSEC